MPPRKGGNLMGLPSSKGNRLSDFTMLKAQVVSWNVPVRTTSKQLLSFSTLW
ncbi:hypothetical protein LEMLEM_LOCUS256 [Lemmus lemmus]